MVYRKDERRSTIFPFLFVFSKIQFILCFLLLQMFRNVFAPRHGTNADINMRFLPNALFA